MFWLQFKNRSEVKKGFDLSLCFQDENGDRVYPDVYLDNTLELGNYPILPRVNDTMHVDVDISGIEPFKPSKEDITYDEECDWYERFLKKFESPKFKVADVLFYYHNPERSATIYLQGILKKDLQRLA